MTLRFTKEHEWVQVDGDVATIGITDYAQQQLGDVVFVELPEKGRTLAQHGEAAVVESVKAASEVYAPLSGEVVETNAALEATPATVNSDAQGGGWFFRLKLSAPAEVDGLMTEDQYRDFLKSLA
jgi:glycine cleavage system H protein